MPDILTHAVGPQLRHLTIAAISVFYLVTTQSALDLDPDAGEPDELWFSGLERKDLEKVEDVVLERGGEVERVVVDLRDAVAAHVKTSLSEGECGEGGKGSVKQFVEGSMPRLSRRGMLSVCSPRPVSGGY